MTTRSEAFERVRGYLVTQAAKLTVAEIVEKVRADSLTLRDAALAISGDRLVARPGHLGAEAWSAAEILTHVLQAGDLCADAIEGMIESGTIPPPLDATNERRPAPLPDIDTSLAYWQALEAHREQLYERALAARGDEHLDATIDHQWFGPLNWRETLLFLRLHDGDHARGLQAIAEWQ